MRADPNSVRQPDDRLVQMFYLRNLLTDMVRRFGQEAVEREANLVFRACGGGPTTQESPMRPTIYDRRQKHWLPRIFYIDVRDLARRLRIALIPA